MFRADLGRRSRLSLPLALLAISILGAGLAAPGFAQKDPPDPEADAQRLNTLCQEQLQAEIFEAAVEPCLQAAQLYQELGDSAAEQQARDRLGLAYAGTDDHDQAIPQFRRAIELAQAIEDFQAESIALDHLLASTEARLNQSVDRASVDSLQPSQIAGAIRLYQANLNAEREAGDRAAEATTLNKLGEAYYALGQYPKTIDWAKQALQIATEIDDSAAKADALKNLGEAHRQLGQYPQAVEFHQQALATERQLGRAWGEAAALNNLGITYGSLGQYAEAIALHGKALAIEQQEGLTTREAISLNNLAAVHDALEQYSQALGFYKQSVKLIQGLADPYLEAPALNNLGRAYAALGDDAQAIELYQQSLAIAQEIGNPAVEASALNNLGESHAALGQADPALQFYQEALAIRQAIGDRASERITLSHLGALLADQNQPALAVTFYKQAVNISESIRQNNQTLPQNLQESFTETVAETYRELANLLLLQDRVLEAQQVLDLLKLEELDAYFQDGEALTRSGSSFPTVSPEASAIEYLPSEKQLLDRYDRAIEQGQELAQLRQIPFEARSPEQQQRITKLVSQEQQVVERFDQFIASPEVTALVDQLSQTERRQNLDLGNLNSLQNNLRSLDQNAVLLYPLLLEDRIELVLVTPFAPPIHRPVPVERAAVERAIADFRTALTNPNSDALAPAQQLYDWLIRPIEADLAAAGAETLVYAPDGQLRYIPLAALHDGSQWLTQRFRINHITAASLTDFNTPSQPNLRILAAAFSQGNHQVQVGQRSFNFAGLPYAGQEVENLVAAIPGTTAIFDQDFSQATLVPRMGDHTVVHLATHAAFVPGQPEESFILFGNGDRVTLKDLRRWNLPNVDLVVLSACETGVGGQLGNGEEILGFGYQLQRTGARAAISSLWAVDDGGTQQLMDHFYDTLKTGQVTKAEALRLAQVNLITSTTTAAGDQRGIGVVATGGQARATQASAFQVALSHPYYWAPFILIGNGL